MKILIILIFFTNVISFSQEKESISNLEVGFKYNYIFTEGGEGETKVENLMIFETGNDNNMYIANSTSFKLITLKNGVEISKTEFLKIFFRWKKYLVAEEDENLDIIMMRANNILKHLKE